MNVYDATLERLKQTFEEFDNISVSFSGGKDSGVMLNMCIDFARKYYPGRRLSILHMDYEAQYQATTDYVDAELEKNRDILDVYRICLPMSVPCATSMTHSYWTPWDADKKDIWVRPLPKDCVNENNHQFPFFKKGMWDYEVQERFSKWLHEKNKAKRTAVLVGIRTQESFHRWKAIHAERTEETNYKDWVWSTEVYSDVYNLYPIFDWKTEDIWVCNKRQNYTYNKLYDLFHQAGVPLSKMRVASPFISQGIESLKLYKVIDPKNWGKLVGRTNGVNFAGLYGGTTAMGWSSIKLPKGHTWKSYFEFLLRTLPKDVQDNYKKKLQTSINYWREKGGEVSLDTIADLKKQGIKLLGEGSTNPVTGRRKIQLEYLDDVHTKEFKLLPTYKRMAICVMKNDHCCKYAGYGLTQQEWILRRGAEAKYKNIVKEMDDDGED